MLNVIFLPVAIAFYYEPDHPGWLTFNICSDIVFLSDVFLNFWTGVISDDNEIILEIRKLRKDYVKKWLIIDLLSLLPFDYVTFFLFSLSASPHSLVQGAQALRLIRPLTKLLSLFKLLRLVKFLHSLSKWEEVTDRGKLGQSPSLVKSRTLPAVLDIPLSTSVVPAEGCLVCISCY
jgi:hypothetical protein